MSIEKLLEYTILSEKIVTTHKNKIQILYNELKASKNEAINSSNDIRDNEDECLPPHRDHPFHVHHDNPTVPGTQHLESRYKGTDNRYNKDHNVYNQLYPGLDG